VSPAQAPSAAARGRFVVLEGLDGCGKSTQARRLAERVRALGREVVHTREPGGTPAGERIRDLLLDPAFGEIVPLAEVLLYQAARAQLVAQVIRPALARGAFVVCERWHYATSAYQGAAGGAPAEAVRASSALATGGLEPDRAVLLDAPDEVLESRLARPRDRIEARGTDYRRRVAAGFRALFAADPARMRTVDARGAEADVAVRIWEQVRDLV
jgi:dTMP kinase